MAGQTMTSAKETGCARMTQLFEAKTDLEPHALCGVLFTHSVAYNGIAIVCERNPTTIKKSSETTVVTTSCHSKMYWKVFEFLFVLLQRVSSVSHDVVRFDASADGT